MQQKARGKLSRERQEEEEERTRRRQKKVNDCSHKWEIAAKVSVRKSLKNVIGLQKYGSQLCK